MIPIFTFCSRMWRIPWRSRRAESPCAARSLDREVRMLTNLLNSSVVTPRRMEMPRIPFDSKPCANFWNIVEPGSMGVVLRRTWPSPKKRGSSPVPFSAVSSEATSCSTARWKTGCVIW